MELQYLEFDCSEDTEGVVCWDALAQPAANHTAALLREVTQLLAWASRFSPQGPGPLDEGHQWDMDLQIHDEEGRPVPLEGGTQPEGRITLALSLSGGAALAGHLP